MSRTALFVSSSAYADDQLARLPSAASDAVELGRLFGDPGIGSFSVDMLTDPRAQEMREALENLFADATPDDVVVLYLSGHGMKDQLRQLVLRRQRHPSRSAAIDRGIRTVPLLRAQCQSRQWCRRLPGLLLRRSLRARDGGASRR